MASYKDDLEKQAAGIPLFKEKRIKDGWTLNIVKQNDDVLSTSLYDSVGKVVENKAFLTQKDEEIDKLREYVRLFEDGPEKNLRRMTNLQVRG